CVLPSRSTSRTLLRYRRCLDAPARCAVQKSHREWLSVAGGVERNRLGRLGFRAGVVASLVYSLIRALVDVFATGRSDRAALKAEVLASGARFRFLSARSSGCAGREAIEWSWPPCMSISRNRLGRDYWCDRRRCLAGTGHWCVGNGLPTVAVHGGADRPSRRSAGT